MAPGLRSPAAPSDDDETTIDGSGASGGEGEGGADGDGDWRWRRMEATGRATAEKVAARQKAAQARVTSPTTKPIGLRKIRVYCTDPGIGR